MAKLTIKELTIYTTQGANRRPAGGSVEFSDGKYYSWWRYDDTVDFVTSRTRVDGYPERMHFRSDKRGALVAALLDSDDCPPVTIIRVS